MAAVRLSDVAREAQVSLATASRVLNGSARVPGAEVAAKVRAAADRLGYVTNAQAQALARSRSGLIGLVVHDIADPYFATLAREVQLRSFDSGTQVLLTQTNRDVETETRAIRSLVAQRVDALVLLGTYRYRNEAEQEILRLLRGFEDGGGVVVAVGQDLGIGRTLVLDDVETSRELADALVAAGHRRFALRESASGIPSAVRRTDGFRSALAAAGVTPELAVATSLDRAGGVEFAARVDEHLRGRDDGGGGTRGDGPRDAEDGGLPLCVFAPADVMAMGMLGELRRRDIAVPGRVAVAGFGGVPAAEDTTPTLTTVALPLSAMAEQAVEWMLGRPAEDGTRDAVQIHGTVELRGSTHLS